MMMGDDYRVEGNKGEEKKWDNCNNIINKIYFKTRNTNWLLQNNHGDAKYSIGNEVVKKYICMAHGYGQLCGDCLK